MRIILIYDSYIRAEKLAKLNLRDNDKVYLFPLTSKVLVTAGLKEKIRNKGSTPELIETARLINAAAEKLRDRYLRYVTEIPERVKYKGRNLKELFAIDKYASLWWLSLISEKNTYKTGSFSKLAQLDSIIEVIKREKIEKVMFGCGDKRLKDAVAEYALKNLMKFEVLPNRSVKGLRQKIRDAQELPYLKHIIFLLSFSLKYYLQIRKIKSRLAKAVRAPIDEEALLLITYFPNLDNKSARKGIFKNTYFAHLQESLENQRKKVIWLAM